MIFELDTYQVIFVVLTLLLSLSLHEWAHAATAYLLGDHTPRQQARLSLNPLNHIDLLGFLAILLVGFGWAKPVQIDPRQFLRPKRDEILVALAGPFSNLLLGCVLLAAYLRGWFPYSLNGPALPLLRNISIPLGPMLQWAVQINLVLFVFNMLPIPPLDGSHLITALIPARMEGARRSFERYGQGFLVTVLLLGAVFNYRFLPISALTAKLIHFLLPWLAPQGMLWS